MVGRPPAYPLIDDQHMTLHAAVDAKVLYANRDERLGSGSIILTSNPPVDDCYSVLPAPVIGGTMLDRLASAAMKLINRQESFVPERGFRIERFSRATRIRD